MMHIAKIVIGVILILIGLAWAVLWMAATCMADRSVSKLETFGPAAVGLLPVALGIWLIAS